MKCQVEKLEHFQHILRFEFNAEGESSQKHLRRVWGKCHWREHGKKWLSSFKEDRFDISDTRCSGRYSELDENRLNTLIHNDTRQCTRELANVMNCDHSIIVRHLHSMGKIKKSGVWVPQTLHQNQKISGWSYVDLCMLVIYWLVNNIDHSYPVSLLVTRNAVFMLT